MRSQPNVVVSLGPTRLDVARIQGGHIIAQASAWLDRSTLEQAWNTDIAALDAPLAQLLRSIGVRSGATAVVEYSSPETSVDVFTLTETEDPIPAACKMLSESSDHDLSRNPSFAVLLGASKENGVTQAHVLCAVDRDERCDILREWLRRAGLSPVAFVPIDAAAIRLAADIAVRADPSMPTVVVHLGEHRTVIVLAHGGELRMARCVSIGTAALIDAVAEASTTGSQSVDAAQRKAAFETLCTSGIRLPTPGSPRRDAADWLLPYLNPALQRYVVEIRQTLRFGLGAHDAARATLVCFGAGNAFPGLAGTLASQLDIALAEDSEDTDHSQSPHTIDLGVSRHIDLARMNLTPMSHRRASQSRRAMWAMGAGTTAALALVAGDGLRVWNQNNRELQTIAQISPTLDQLSARLLHWKEAADLRRENNEIYRAIRQGLGDQPDWKLVFADVASAAQESMKFTDLAIDASAGGATMSIRGLIAASSPAETPDADAGSAMSRFLTTLAATAAVESADLGETRTAEVRGVPVEVFAADARLRGVPFVLPSRKGDSQ